MANEFVARKGIISLDSIQVTGSISATGGIIISGSIASASYASNAELLDGRDSTIFATTGSNIFSGNQTICGNLTTTGTITAQTINVQQVTSSVVYSSGSNIFGNQLINTQEFTGSMFITGSNFRVTATNNCFSGQVCSNTLATAGAVTLGGALTGTSATFSSTATATIFDATSNAYRLNGNNALSLVTLGGQSVVKINAAGFWGTQLVGANDQGILINNSGNVGIGVTAPNAKLEILGTSSDQLRLSTAATEHFRIGRNASTGYLDFYGSQTGYVGYLWGGVDGTRMTLSSSGNLGLGVTPSAWNLGKAIEISGGPSVLGLSNSTQISNNAYYNSGWIYKATSFAQNFVLDNDGSFKFFQAPSGTAGNAISFTQAMTLDASGNLLVGLTTGGKLSVRDAGGNDTHFGLGANYDNYISAGTNGVTIFRNATTERLRITNSGNIGINTGSPSQLFTVVSTNNNTSSFSGFYALNGSQGVEMWYGGIRMGGSNTDVDFNLSSKGAANLVFNTNSSERLRITSGGNVGIGTTSPVGKLDVALLNTRRFIVTYDDSIVTIKGANDTGAGENLRIIGDNLIFNTSSTGSGTERMRITSIGNLELSCNLILNTGSNKYIRIGSATNYYYDVRMSNDNFQIAEAGSTVRMSINYPGGITCFSSTVCAPCFATISDYRMKSNLRPIEGLSIIMNTKPYKFEYNYDCSTSFGMIAHELQEVLPEAVFGVKDGENMQGVDYMKLLPIAIKAIQEQQCTICSLKTCLGIS